MMLMCVPMVAVVAVLIATGVASLGLIFGAIMCVAMMAMMMRMMSGGGEKR
jgi:hypothetical protein